MQELQLPGCIINLILMKLTCYDAWHSCKTHYITLRGVARNLFRRGTKQGDWGQKSPSGVQGQSPGGGMGAKPQKLKTYMLITTAIMCWPKTPIFFNMGISGGICPPCLPPSLCPWLHYFKFKVKNAKALQSLYRHIKIYIYNSQVNKGLQSQWTSLTSSLS